MRESFSRYVIKWQVQRAKKGSRESRVMALKVNLTTEEMIYFQT